MSTSLNAYRQQLAMFQKDNKNTLSSIIVEEEIMLVLKEVSQKQKNNTLTFLNGFVSNILSKIYDKEQTFTIRLDEQKSTVKVKFYVTEDNIETFKDCWDWEVLSDKSCIDMTHELLIKYADRWNWAYIIDRYGDDSITYNEEFLEKYGEYIPASELGGSKLWDCIIEKRIKALKQEILA